MRPVIEKERIHLFSPCAQVCAVARLAPELAQERLRQAIQTAVWANRILGSRVELAKDGTAALVEAERSAPLELQPYDDTASALILAQERLPFDLEHGETIRFFVKRTSAYLEMCVIVHHVVCDGGSLIRLMQDILRALNGQEVKERPIRLLKGEDLPEHPPLRLGMRWMLKGVNGKWRKSGKVFGFADYRQMAARYAQEHPTALCFRQIDAPQLQRLTALCHQERITLNSLLSAAFSCTCADRENIGIAVDVRPEGCESIGNFATGISVQAAWRENQTLMENARRIHDAIQRKRNDPREMYFLHDFMTSLSPTLVDSIYFARYGGCQNALSQATAKMCGYVDAPGGLSLTNLKTIQMPDVPAAGIRYQEMCFVPPYIPNVRSVIGISTYEQRLTLTLHTAQALLVEEEKKLEQAYQLLLSQ